MSRMLVSQSDVGRPCPYCRFPLKEGTTAERCDSCGSLHHEDCWRDGRGCSQFGCPGAGTAQQPTVAGQPGWGGAPVGQAHGSPAWSQHAAHEAVPVAGQMPPRGANRTILLVSAAIALLGIGAGALVASGVLSHQTPPPQAAAATHPVASVPDQAQAQTNARSAIMGLLDTYQRAYSQHDLEGLSGIFSPQIVRHGLATGGCTVSHGRQAVLADYESQFTAGSGSYELIGLSAAQIQLDSSKSAHLDAHYSITPGGTGFVNFKFAEAGEGWKISEVYATCA